MRRRLTIIVAAVALTVAGAALETEKKPVDVVRKLGLVPSFNEDFSGTSLDPRHWRTSYGAKPDAKSTIADRSLPGNNERQIYVEPGYLGLGLNPFRLRDGVLTISAEPLSVTARSRVMSELASLPPQKNTAALARVAFSSGLISTRSRFAQRYGYFEMRAKWSGGKGLWPAFWLLPDDGTWPPELDVLEAHGDKPKV
ncbi:MAG: glycoside hydrolase, partial [Sphingomonas bacterium]|nr:glycoside hydrolase [Sphingomonas bacterium]